MKGPPPAVKVHHPTIASNAFRGAATSAGETSSASTTPRRPPHARPQQHGHPLAAAAAADAAAAAAAADAAVAVAVATRGERAPSGRKGAFTAAEREGVGATWWQGDRRRRRQGGRCQCRPGRQVEEARLLLSGD